MCIGFSTIHSFRLTEGLGTHSHGVGDTAVGSYAMQVVDLKSFWYMTSPEFNTTKVLPRKENLDTGTHCRRSPCEDEWTMGRDIFLQTREWPRLTVKPQQLEDRHKTDSLSKSSQGTNTANTFLDFGLQNKLSQFLMFKQPSLR